jgi:hypothetical protein
MQTLNIIKEIEKLPLNDKIQVVENTMKSIRKEANKVRSLKEAAKALLPDYKKDKELLAFTSLDSDDFYET